MGEHGFDLEELGWDESLERQFAEYRAAGLVPARVVTAHRKGYVVHSASGAFQSKPVGQIRQRQMSQDVDGTPTVGDWVAVELEPDRGHALIHAILPRRSLFVRKAPGRSIEAQALAANIDVAFIVDTLEGAPNLRRIERFLTVVSGSGASAVVVLSKADLAIDPDAAVAGVGKVAPGIQIHVVSGTTGQGLEAFSPYLARGKTIALLGTSGVGKSTLVNALFGEALMRTSEVRGQDLRGRHTTTARHLVCLPSGGVLIDSPGIREIQPWDADGLESVFEDIAEVASECRFSDCKHDREPGCAVREAVEAGRIDPDRLAAFIELSDEARELELRRSRQTRDASRAVRKPRRGEEE